MPGGREIQSIAVKPNGELIETEKNNVAKRGGSQVFLGHSYTIHTNEAQMALF